MPAHILVFGIAEAKRREALVLGDGVPHGEVAAEQDAVGPVDSHELARAAVALAQDWRNDKVMRKLEAMMIVADKEALLVISGTGEVIEPDDGIAAIGSGGLYALAAAKALVQNTDLSAVEIARKGLEIAGQICVFTNDQLSIEEV